MMDATRKPGNGLVTDPTCDRGPACAGGTLPDRRIVPRRGPVPRWMYIVLIGVPAIGIGVLLGLSAAKSHPPRNAAEVQPGDRMRELALEVHGIEKAYHEVQELLLSQDPADNKKGNGRADGLRKRMEDWLGEFDGILDSKRDADDRLPKEWQGYMAIRQPVSQSLSDLNNITGF